MNEREKAVDAVSAKLDADVDQRIAGLPVAVEGFDVEAARRALRAYRGSDAVSVQTIDAALSVIERQARELDGISTYLRAHHNGYEPEARAALPTLTEPATMLDAIKALVEEREQLETLELAELRLQRDDAQDRIVTWALCPKCGLPVPCTSVPCIAGRCRCGYDVIESEADPCDPVEMVADLREELAAALRAVFDLQARSQQAEETVIEERAESERLRHALETYADRTRWACSDFGEYHEHSSRCCRDWWQGADDADFRSGWAVAEEALRRPPSSQPDSNVPIGPPEPVDGETLATIEAWQSSGGNGTRENPERQPERATDYQRAFQSLSILYRLARQTLWGHIERDVPDMTWIDWDDQTEAHITECLGGEQKRQFDQSSQDTSSGEKPQEPQ